MAYLITTYAEDGAILGKFKFPTDDIRVPIEFLADTQFEDGHILKLPTARITIEPIDEVL